MRDSTNHDDNADTQNGSRDPSATPPPEDDLRSIMSGRPTRPPELSGTGEYSADAKSDSEPAWSDATSDRAPTDAPPWQGRDIDSTGESMEHTYERPPFYTSSEDAMGRLHPEEVARFGPPAGFVRRLVAYFIDFAVTLFILGLLFPLLLGTPLFDFDATAVENELDTTGETNVPSVALAPTESDEATQLNEEQVALTDLLPWYGTLSGTILFLVLPIIYHTLLIGIWGTTLGKRLLNVYVLDKSGHVPGIPIAFMRAVTSVVSANILYIGHLFIFRTDHRALHDLLVGTYTITRSSAEDPAARGEEFVE